LGVLLSVEIHDQNAVLETLKSIGRLSKGDTCGGRVHEVVIGEGTQPKPELGVFLHQYTPLFGLSRV
jgi:hypothetical protein